MTAIVQRFFFASSSPAAAVAVRALACRQTVVVSQNQLLASSYHHFAVKNRRQCLEILSQNIVKQQQQQQQRTTMSENNNSSGTPSAGKPKVIFVLGAPGSGKGTQCANIVSQYNYVHLSAGDLLRAERNRPGSELAQTIEEHIRAGKIIPVAVTCSLIEQAMNEQMEADPAKNKFLIDGFPRNQDNLDGWVKEMEDKVNLQFVLFFECPDGVCIDRCLSRGVGRSDDNIESLKKRFNVFHSDTMPIVDYYEQKYLVRRVNSEKPPELVFEAVQEAFNDYNAK